MSVPTKAIQGGVIAKVSCAFDIAIRGCDAQVTVSYDAESCILDEHLFPAFLVKHMCADHVEVFTLVETLFDLLIKDLDQPSPLKLKVKINKTANSSTVIEFAFKQRKRKNKEQVAEE